MRISIVTLFVAALLGNSAVFGEEKTAPKVETKPAKVESVTVAEYTFKYSKPWVKQQAGGMRSAVLRYAQDDEKLENVDAVFFHMGGTVQSNLDRWKGQFSGDAKTSVEEKEVNGVKVSFFTGKGTFADSMGGPFAPKTDKSDFGVLGAILPSANGRLVFLKLKGPAASVDAVKDSFMKLTESALEKK